MVKGLSRRVVMVRLPDEKVFEQAIFLVRDDAPDTAAGAGDIVREACRVADGYVTRRQKRGGAPGPLTAVFWAMGGAGVTGIAWVLAALLG